MYCVRVSLCGQSKYYLPITKEKGVVGNLCISLLISSNFFRIVVQGGGNDWAGGRPGPGHMQRDDRGFKGEPTYEAPIRLAQ
jgi:hypothetical protein